MRKFLGYAIAGFVLLAIAPALFKSGPVGTGLAILILFFIVAFIAKKLLGMAVGGVGFFVVLVVVLLFLNNPQSCSTKGSPTSDLGKLTEVNRLGYFAVSDYDRCIQGFVVQQASVNTRMENAAAACAADATAFYNACLPRVEDEWWHFDKPGYCRDLATRSVWRSCVLRALDTMTDAGDLARTSCMDKSLTTGLMKEIAGLFSFASYWSGSSDSSSSPSSQPAVRYNTSCLVQVFNSNLGYMPELNCNQYTSTVFYPDGRKQVETNNEAAFQDCLVRSITQGLKEQGTQLVNACVAR